MSKHLVTVVKKNSPLTGRKLKQNRAPGERPSALTGCFGRERRRGREERRDTEKHRNNNKTITTITEIEI